MWKVGFSFRQRGIPDGHTVISTQTGGAGSVIFTNHPSRADRGEATDGSAVFHIDDLGAAPEPQFTIGLVRGNYSYGPDETTLRLVGVVTHTNDDRCQAGAKVSVTLYQRHNPSQGVFEHGTVGSIVDQSEPDDSVTRSLENVPSRRVAEQAGFTLEGVLRSAHWNARLGRRQDWAMYSLLRDELRSERSRTHQVREL